MSTPDHDSLDAVTERLGVMTVSTSAHNWCMLHQAHTIVCQMAMAMGEFVQGQEGREIHAELMKALNGAVPPVVETAIIEGSIHTVQIHSEILFACTASLLAVRRQIMNGQISIQTEGEDSTSASTRIMQASNSFKEILLASDPSARKILDGLI